MLCSAIRHPSLAPWLPAGYSRSSSQPVLADALVLSTNVPVKDRRCRDLAEARSACSRGALGQYASWRTVLCQVGARARGSGAVMRQIATTASISSSPMARATEMRWCPSRTNQMSPTRISSTGGKGTAAIRAAATLSQRSLSREFSGLKSRSKSLRRPALPRIREIGVVWVPLQYHPGMACVSLIESKSSSQPGRRVIAAVSRAHQPRMRARQYNRSAASCTREPASVRRRPKYAMTCSVI